MFKAKIQISLDYENSGAEDFDIFIPNSQWIRFKIYQYWDALSGGLKSGTIVYSENVTEASFDILLEGDFSPVPTIYDEFNWLVKTNRCQSFNDAKVRNVILSTVDIGPCPGIMENYINKDWNLGMGRF